jgi:hypothetical protein
VGRLHLISAVLLVAFGVLAVSLFLLIVYPLGLLALWGVVAVAVGLLVIPVGR